MTCWKKTSLVLSLGLAGVAFAAEWEDTSVNSVNRLPARAYTPSLVSLKDALSDDLVPPTPYELSLNGDWRFRWFGNPTLAEAEKDFFRPDYDVSRWDTIDVPSCVEMRGYGTPGYSNQEYPHFDTTHPTNALFAKILDFHSRKPDYNPTSLYRRTFTVPERWNGRRTILRFEGVGSAYYVWVNGHKVGYAEDSKLPSEFDITPYLKEGQGNRSRSTADENVLCVEVLKWCDGSFLEDQDFFRYSGIFRDVSLVSVPKDGIWDIAVRTYPLAKPDRWELQVKVEGEGRMSVSLYDADKNKVCDLHSTPTPNTYTTTLAARAWSSEDPYLYTLVVRRGDDYRRLRVGFKEQHIDGAVFKVNGRPIKFHGVNRHDTTAENGRTVTFESMVEDLKLMKTHNIDTVRTSHYPNPRLWYDLCDKYGVYLVAEANIEGHGSHFVRRGQGLFKEWNHTIVERNVRHVKTYGNHVAITLWSLGNETEHGDCFRNAKAAIRELDATRPIHWERGNVDADVDSAMYPSVDWLNRRGQLGEGLIDSIEDQYESPQFKNKCFFLCEYAHAMGNAIGNLQEYWDVFYTYPSLAGGCIWDWVDQAVWKYTGEIDPATGRPERYLAYGGDWDESPNDGPFCCNGIIKPDRQVTPKLIEVAHVFRPVQLVKTSDGGYELVNRMLFTDVKAFNGRWELIANGRRVAEGAFEVPSVAPLARVPFDVSAILKQQVPDGCECFLNLRFETKAAAGLVPAGHVVAREQIAVAAAPAKSFEAAGDVVIDEREGEVTVRCAGTTAVFSPKTGTLSKLTMNGETVLEDPASGVVSGPRLTCMRAFTDNDKGIPRTMERSGLTQLAYHSEPFRVLSNGVEIVTRVTGRKSGGFNHVSRWLFAKDGSVVVENEVQSFGTVPRMLTRLGLSLRLKPDYENVAYYGRGPHENYPDRLTGAFFGLWNTTVSDLYVDYVRPQDNGRRCDVRWVEFTNAKGRGVRFEGSEPLTLQALHCTREDLYFARHVIGERRRYQPVPKRPDVYVDLDVRMAGLGGHSCGPTILPQYKFPTNERIAWSMRISPTVTAPSRVTDSPFVPNETGVSKVTCTRIHERRLGWVTAHAMNEDDDWESTAVFLKKWGFTDMVALVARGACAYYDSKILPRAVGLPEGRNAAREAVEACHRQGLKCHLWKTTWQVRDDTQGDYLQRLEQENRFQMTAAGKVDKGWLCPSDERNRAVEINVMKEFIALGADAVHFDYNRYKGKSYCFCPRCLSAFSKVVGRTVSSAKEIRADAALARQWDDFRAELISSVVREVAEYAHAQTPRIEVSAAVFHDPPLDYAKYAQDWPRWCREGWLDVVSPMDYNYSPDVYGAFLKRQKEYLKGTRTQFCPGLGITCIAYPELPLANFREELAHVRENGCDGFSIFKIGKVAMELFPQVFGK